MDPASDNVNKERAMDLKIRLESDEADLKALIERLNAAESIPQAERERALRALGRKLVEIRAFIDDCMSGRTDHEKAVLEYKLRVEYPLFAHLASLSALSREYVEWSCA
jgi:hypothetical protein